MEDDQILEIVKARDKYLGLTTGEADKQAKIFGFNTRPAVKHKTWVKRLWGIITEPMMLLLSATAAVYFFIGDKVETVILLFSIIPIGLMEFFQEQRTDEAIKVLDKMMVQFVEVYRDGKLEKMEIKYLVPGDLVYLTAGDKIPADGLLLKSPGLRIDEAILTGESMSVIKSVVGDDLKNIKEENKMWQGTLLVQGEGYMLVTETGGNTAYGKLGNLLEKIVQTKTPLQQKIHRLVRMVAIVAIFVAVFVGLILTWRQGWQQGILGGLTMAMSLIPEEFPVVFSVFLIMGVWRMTKQNALIREMAMVETLGSATVICTDKTGTLTEGKMALVKVFYKNKIIEIKKENHPEELQPLFQSSLLALEQVAIDPMEIEVQDFSRKIKIPVDDFYRQHVLLSESPFESSTKLVHHLWKNDKGVCCQYTAGAPESVLQNSNLTETEIKRINAVYEQLAGEGLRVIAIAQRKCEADDKISIGGWEFVGIIAMSDPPRLGVKEAVDTCQKAGIRVIMITGDNKLTAHNIAESIGLKHNENIITGADLENLSPNAWQEMVKRHDIFTRVKPEQKFQIVEALQVAGSIVAMTGDGVNDAPALKKSNIGIAMGQKGTEVARAAAGIVLMDDNFTTIVNAVKEGRRIYDNLRQAFVFLFSFHLPILGLAILPLFFGQPLVFFPIHIIFLELICDPAAVIGFEKERARRGLMAEPPRPVNESLINPLLWKNVFLQGLGILAVSFGFYYYFAIVLGDIELGRTLAFGSLVASQTFLILLTREWEQVKTNLLLFGISGVTLLVLAVILFTPFLRKVFHLVEINIVQFGLMLLIPLLAMFIIGQFTRHHYIRKKHE